MLIKTFLSADLRIPEVGVPVPPSVTDGIPLLHVSLIASPTEPVANREGVATSFPDKVDA